ncbi:hypothetical protein Enr8_50840 [Blastopirellula retiformator]|uniref:Uncharacterized protein n=1 Tax=Blastopirellula retiformator TaxID=2527970 RepID=A0A5C5UUK3_9BACT|nr:hypothetical protein Enr8_50840 [Blastopirellula retiformator]
MAISMIALLPANSRKQVERSGVPYGGDGRRHLLFQLGCGVDRVANSPLIFSTDCVIARMRSQNNDVSRYFASREELCSEPGEVGKCHDGIFQQAVNDARRVRLFAISLGG